MKKYRLLSAVLIQNTEDQCGNQSQKNLWFECTFFAV